MIMSVERGNSISTSFIVRGVSEGDFSRFCITSFVCNTSLPWLLRKLSVHMQSNFESSSLALH